MSGIDFALTALFIVILLDQIKSTGMKLPALIAVAVTVALHLWKRNTLISVVGGTACYMLLVQLIFA